MPVLKISTKIDPWIYSKVVPLSGGGTFQLQRNCLRLPAQIHIIPQLAIALSLNSCVAFCLVILRQFLLRFQVSGFVE